MLKKVEKIDSYGRKEVYTEDENGLKQGLYLQYSENGKLKSKRVYKDDKKDGVCEHYYTDGKLEGKYTYRNDKWNGPYELYNANGQLFSKGSYLTDRLDGPFEQYDKSGHLAVRSVYKEGEYDGLYESFYPTGQLNKRIEYKNGLKHGVYESYSLEGKPELREFYKEDKWDGPSERFDSAGRCVGQQVWKDGELLEGQEAEDYLKEWEKEQEKARRKAKIEAREKDPEWQDLRERLKHLTDGKYYKKVPRARTPERQVELEEILMTRRAKAVLLKAATKARLAGDKDRFDAIMKLAEPFAKKHDLVVHLFHDKRAENKKRTRKNSGR